MNNIETMKLALEALEIVNREMLTLRDELAERGGRPKKGIRQLLWDSSHKVYTDTAIPTAEALRQAIEQAQQAEPVAYGTWDTMLGKGNRMMMVRLDKGQDGCTVPLYTAPPPRQPLTDEEINKKWSEALADTEGQTYLPLTEFARAIEAAHGIRHKRQHITDGSTCWCNPETDYVDPKTGAAVVVHKEPQ